MIKMFEAIKSTKSHFVKFKTQTKQISQSFEVVVDKSNLENIIILKFILIGFNVMIIK